MDRAGIETMLMNYYRNMDRSLIQFDFLTHRPQEGAYDKEIIRLGGKVYHAPRLYPQNSVQYFQYMKSFWAEHPEYKIAHSQIESMSYLPLLTAKKANVPIRIAHSHSTSLDLDFRLPLKLLYKKMLPTVATHYAACSKEAGQFLFGSNDFTLIPNAIEIKKYFFNEVIREKKRLELGINGKFVIGHVGRFTKAKNHFFIIDLFKSIYEQNNSAELLLIGDGELRDEVVRYISKEGLQDKVIILSGRDDVNELYQAMDIFIFPSLYEGLGMSAIEAQVSGLKCFISDAVPLESSISDETQYLPLDKNQWLQEIIAWHPKGERKSIYSEKYDVKIAASHLSNYYLSLSNTYRGEL